MVIPQIGNVEIELVYEIFKEPAIIILLLLSGLAGLLAGKQESDDAKNGKGDPIMANVTIADWLMDFGYGLIGGCIGIGVLFMTPVVPIFVLPSFGYAGRKLLIAWGRKAESASPRPE